MHTVPAVEATSIVPGLQPGAIRIRVIRAAWLTYALLVLAVMIAGLPLVWRQLQSACDGAGCLYGQLSTAGMARLAQTGLPLTNYATLMTLLPLTVPLLAIVLATIVLWRRSDDRMALLFALVMGTCPLNLSNALPALANIYPISRLPAQLIEFGFASFLPFFFLFPDGRFVPRWSRWLVFPNFLVVGVAVFFPSSAMPDTLIAGFIGVWTAIAVFTTFGFQAYRYRFVASPIERQQIKWLTYGLGVTAGTGIVFAILAGVFGLDLQPGSPGFLIQSVVTPLSIGFFAVAMWIAVVRYRLFEIDVIINRTLVYGLLSVCVVAIYAVAVGAVGMLLQSSNSFLSSLVAAGAVAVLFQPLRVHLQLNVNRLLYGRRDEPQLALAQLGSRLEMTPRPEAILPTIVDSVREMLKLPFAAIVLDDGDVEIRTTAGAAKGQTLTLPLSYQGREIGQLIVTPRAGETELHGADRRLLSDIARQAGIAAHAVLLTRDLQRSREQLVTLREEERRRMRRDLHDGLGPSLATMTLQAETARSLVRFKPDEAEALLDELTQQAQATMQEVRQLIHALRPPVLDDLGLAAALRALAASYSQSGVAFTATTADDLPTLPAAVEVAVYRIAQEAMTNVVKHAHARHCAVTLSGGDQALSLEVCDDGRGIAPTRTSGVGFSSMRERAEELGGAFTTAAAANGGTTVWARLPLRSSYGADSSTDRR